MCMDYVGSSVPVSSSQQGRSKVICVEAKDPIWLQVGLLV